MPSPTTPPSTRAPRPAPTNPPTVGPTLACNQDPSLRALLIRVILNTVSDSATVDTEGSPQNQAANWIIQQDARFLCPDDPDLVPRYSMAVFYYSTRGDRWLECMAPTDFSDPAAIDQANTDCTIQPFPDSGSDAWLTPSDICQWGGIVCSDSGAVELMDLGKCHEE